MYEPIINVVTNQVRSTVEDAVMSEVRSIGIDVNKDELVKALAYDRAQYDKGFKDGKKSFSDKIPDGLIEKLTAVVRDSKILYSEAYHSIEGYASDYDTAAFFENLVVCTSMTLDILKEIKND